MSKLRLNPGFDPAAFLQQNWQQTPVLLPQLIPDFNDLISPAELAGLASEDWIESRLIQEIESGRWQLQHGPFEETVFTTAPESHWTVLVQAVDQWVAEVAHLRSLFEFIPRWRIDDVMVSYAADKGSVGPHFDHYDVVLLQGSGQRLWQVGGKVPPESALEIQDGVGILREFTAEHEFVLNPGDALYLPPQYAHWGQSVGPSTCYSIGFRAPAISEMMEGFSDRLIAASPPHHRYTDTLASVPTHPASIDPAAVAAAYTRVQAELAAPAQFQRWFGCFVTQPKYPELREPLAPPLTPEDLQRSLAAGKQLQQAPGSRFAFLQAEKDAGMLWFVDGEVFEMSPTYSKVIPEICESTLLNKSTFLDHDEAGALLVIVLQLLNQGSLQLL